MATQTNQQSLSKDSLEAAANSLLKALEAEDVETVANQFDEKSVDVDTGGVTVSREDFTRDLKRKGPLYCVLFDTSCLRREPGNENAASLRDLWQAADREEGAASIDLRPASNSGRVVFYGPPFRTVRNRKIGKTIGWVNYRFKSDRWKVYSLWVKAKLPTLGSDEKSTPIDATEIASLEQAGEELVSVLRTGNPLDLPQLCRKQGVVVDIDGTVVSPSDLSRMIARKNWFYCSYFDAACEARKAERGQRKHSLRETLADAASVKVRASTRTKPGKPAPFGIITLQIDGTLAKSELDENDRTFIYSQEQGEWKIACFGCDPEFW
ncbi:MAG: hypothetical protein NVS9B14_20520 [Candidatus Acidiferrum sp.]